VSDYQAPGISYASVKEEIELNYFNRAAQLIGRAKWNDSAAGRAASDKYFNQQSINHQYEGFDAVVSAVENSLKENLGDDAGEAIQAFKAEYTFDQYVKAQVDRTRGIESAATQTLTAHEVAAGITAEQIESDNQANQINEYGEIDTRDTVELAEQYDGLSSENPESIAQFKQYMAEKSLRESSENPANIPQSQAAAEAHSAANAPTTIDPESAVAEAEALLAGTAGDESPDSLQVTPPLTQTAKDKLASDILNVDNASAGESEFEAWVEEQTKVERETLESQIRTQLVEPEAVSIGGALLYGAEAGVEYMKGLGVGLWDEIKALKDLLDWKTWWGLLKVVGSLLVSLKNVGVAVLTNGLGVLEPIAQAMSAAFETDIETVKTHLSALKDQTNPHATGYAVAMVVAALLPIGKLAKAGKLGTAGDKVFDAIEKGVEVFKSTMDDLTDFVGEAVKSYRWNEADLAYNVEFADGSTRSVSKAELEGGGNGGGSGVVQSILPFNDPKFTEIYDDLVNNPSTRVYPNLLSIAEEAALKFYSTDAYKNLNNALRGSTPMTEAFEAQTALINQALDKLPSSVYNGEGKVLYRAVNFTDEEVARLFKEGGEFTENGFASTTYSQEAISTYMRDVPKNVLLRIEGKTGKLIEDISLKPGEKEVLFKSGTKFEVMKIDISADPTDGISEIKTIWLKEI